MHRGRASVLEKNKDPKSMTSTSTWRNKGERADKTQSKWKHGNGEPWRGDQRSRKGAEKTDKIESGLFEKLSKAGEPDQLGVEEGVHTWEKASLQTVQKAY